MAPRLVDGDTLVNGFDKDCDHRWEAVACELYVCIYCDARISGMYVGEPLRWATTEEKKKRRFPKHTPKSYMETYDRYHE